MISFRVAFDIPFDMTIPTAHGLYSVRLGSQGLSLSSFRPLSDDERLTRSSNNANFSTDFSSTAQPLQAPATCASYDDIFLALSPTFSESGGSCLITQFADPSNNPLRVTRTLQYAIMYMSRAVSHLPDDSPSWWRDFCAAIEAIEYRSFEWLLARQNLPSPCNERPPAHLSAAAGPNRRRSARTTGMPEHIRQLVPRRADGTEPCLRFFGGGMCFGDSCERCA
ncbi:hypothetical protein PHYSODRAFT_508073 [Phytophthora sojae]|uniref:Uncharacterized protein n=1 Tax=Phytophthora sojae (strain P6497) TaxID=1094619 RepID=G4ZJW9_PHYSP|nr:hypothetical protein PHYSODRAFT_508073 [Phytophthora sojae]EGZ14451.1 hypothetical protein PHYSODRAFT_508073 [Phytophthora sojae]|eukprot:XP_009528200.1 hypothetical protein PHYSODRAFT_508073 [Phytophthora sojae]